MTEIKVIPIFSSPLGIVNFGEQARELNETLIKNIEDERTKYQTAREERTFSGTPGTWQSQLGQEILYQSFALLKDLISQVVLVAMEQTGYEREWLKDGVSIGNLWSNVIFDGGWSQPHVHGTGNTLWTGVYYPHTPFQRLNNIDEFDQTLWIKAGNNVKEQGSLVIQDPARIQKSLVVPRTGLNKYPYYGSNIYVIPRESLLVLFPATTEHYVTPVTDGVVRYSISFGVQKKKREDGTFRDRDQSGQGQSF